MAEQPHCLCRREKELDRLFNEVDIMRSNIDTKMNTATFWTVIGIVFTILTLSVTIHITADADEFKGLQEQITTNKNNSIESDKTIVKISTQYEEIIKRLNSLDSKLK